MALSRAEHLCPEATFLPARLNLYRSAALALFQLLNGQMPAVEQAQPGGLYLDLRGLEGRDAEAMTICHGQCDAILRELRLEATAGVAVNKFSAEAASLSIGPNRILALAAGTERAFLAGFPVSVLPVSEEAQRRLHLFGLRRLAQFARLPPAAVLAQFGWEGERAHRFAARITGWSPPARANAANRPASSSIRRWTTWRRWPRPRCAWWNGWRTGWRQPFCGPAGSPWKSPALTARS